MTVFGGIVVLGVDVMVVVLLLSTHKGQWDRYMESYIVEMIELAFPDDGGMLATEFAPDFVEQEPSPYRKAEPW